MVGFIDLDGTLLDTRTALFESYSDAAAAYGIYIEQDLFNRKCFGNRAEEGAWIQISIPKELAGGPTT